MSALTHVEVTQQDSAPCGFQLSFGAEPGTAAADAFAIVQNDLLQPFNRVLIRVSADGVATTLIDGFITHHQFAPSNGPGDSTFTVTGEDVSVKMDLIDYSREFPALPDHLTVYEILAPWLALGVIPEVVPALTSLVPVDFVPQQAGTDRATLQQLAQKNGHVFYVTPNDTLFENTAYWGPPDRSGSPSAVVDVAVGAASTADQVQAQFDALAPVTYFGLAIETFIEPYLPLPVLTTGSSRMPPLASRPALTPESVLSLDVKHQLFQAGGLDPVRANIQAQAQTDVSTDAVVTLSCQTSTARLGTIVSAPGVVGVRGTGDSYDGLYYLKSATHTISLVQGDQWDYTQALVMTREGVGKTTTTLEAQ
jgi:hypothetical protein